MRGDGPVAPRAIEMLGGEDHTMLDLSGVAFDLSDSGVTGPPHPGPLDAYVWLPARRDGRGDGAAARQCRPTYRHSGACDREAAKRSGAPRRDAGAVSRSVATSAGKVVERRSGWDLDGRGEGRFESSQYTALVFGGPASARPSDLSVMLFGPIPSRCPATICFCSVTSPSSSYKPRFQLSERFGLQRHAKAES